MAERLLDECGAEILAYVAAAKAAEKAGEEVADVDVGYLTFGDIARDGSTIRRTSATGATASQVPSDRCATTGCSTTRSAWQVPRSVRRKDGVMFTSFLPAVSKDALNKMSAKVRSWRLHRRVNSTGAELAEVVNPVVRGWMNYYGTF